jgi:RES domain-containing protein
VSGNPPNEPPLHSIERLIRVLERASLTEYSGFSYRVIADKWRDSPLSAIGAVQRGGRYNAPRTFLVLYSADSQLTALLEAEALFTTADGQLQGVPRDPDLILTIKCSLERVLDLTVPTLFDALGTSHAELVSSTPSRFILNARNKRHPHNNSARPALTLEGFPRSRCRARRIRMDSASTFLSTLLSSESIFRFEMKAGALNLKFGERSRGRHLHNPEVTDSNPAIWFAGGPRMRALVCNLYSWPTDR